MKKDYYYYIAKNSVEFLIQVKKLLEVKFKGVNYKTLKFIDVGCGIGDKVLLASFVFELICDGVEYNSHYYELAQFNKSVTREKVAFIKKDAFEMSFEAYDFVYMYCPIQDADLMEDLNIHIWRTLKKGAIFYDIGSEHNPAFKRLSRRKKGLLTREQPYFCK